MKRRTRISLHYLAHILYVNIRKYIIHMKVCVYIHMCIHICVYHWLRNFGVKIFLLVCQSAENSACEKNKTHIRTHYIVEPSSDEWFQCENLKRELFYSENFLIYNILICVYKEVSWGMAYYTRYSLLEGNRWCNLKQNTETKFSNPIGVYKMC